MVEPDEEGMRLDRWFKAHYPETPNSCFHKLVRTGQIRVASKRAKGSTRLQAGQKIRVPFQCNSSTPSLKGEVRSLSSRDRALFDSNLLFEDEDLLILNKPAGLAVQGGTRTVKHIDGFLSVLGAERGIKYRLVHRLDRDTSGVLILAKNQLSASGICRLFAEHRVQKFYLAMVRSIPEQFVGFVDSPLPKVRENSGEQVRVESGSELSSTLQSLTYYQCLGHSCGFSIFGLRPVTGRKHQIRIHMSMIGHPILGDRRYGDRHAASGFNGTQGDSAENSIGDLKHHLHLHARQICFPHPRGGQEIRVFAPLPTHMCHALELLGIDVGICEGDMRDLDLYRMHKKEKDLG